MAKIKYDVNIILQLYASNNQYPNFVTIFRYHFDTLVNFSLAALLPYV